MVDTPVKLTTSEAGFVVNQPTSAVNKAIDRGEIVAKLAPAEPAVVSKPKPVKPSTRAARLMLRSASARRLIGAAELRYLMLIGLGYGKDLTPTGRKTIYRAIQQAGAARRIRWKVTNLELDPIDQALKARLKRLDEVKAAVQVRPGGEVVFRKTEIPVYPVAALAKGQSVAEILQDYPGLTEGQVKIAVDYATAYPKSGRQYPARSLKRTLGDLAEGGVFDVEPDAPVTLDDFR